MFLDLQGQDKKEGVLVANAPPLDYSFKELRSCAELETEEPRSGKKRPQLDSKDAESAGVASPSASKANPHEPKMKLVIRKVTTSIKLNNNMLESIVGLPQALEFCLPNPLLNLQWLDISFNQLVTVEPDLLRFYNLKALYMHGNCISRLSVVDRLRRLLLLWSQSEIAFGLLLMLALLVLAGSVLTSYVGVVGLFQRMAGDRCLPEFFSETNTWRNTPHYTILVFFGVCSSMCIMLDGDITLLAAIYSISFLLVMGLFAFCGLWLKINRPTLPREIKSHPAFFVCGLLLVSCAFTAVVLLHPEMLTYFYIYYGITTTMVMLTFARVSIFKSFLQLMSHSKVARFIIQWFVHKRVAEEWAHQKLKNLQDQGVVYFTKRASMSQINRALQYIEQNEEARWVKVIHCYTDLDQIPPNLEEYVRILDCVYPTLKVDSILVRGEFSPAMVQYISKRIQVKVNCMFINCPKIDFKHPLDRMGGVRVILNSEKPNPFKRLAGTTSPFFGLSPTSPMRGNDYMALVQDKLSEDEKDMQSSPDYSFNLDLDRGN